MSDSLLVSSIGFQGTMFCVIAGSALHTLSPVKSYNIGLIIPIIILTALGITILYILTHQIINFGTVPATNEELNNAERTRKVSPFASVVKQRVLIFIFSCIWGILKQFYWHTFPSPFRSKVLHVVK